MTPRRAERWCGAGVLLGALLLIGAVAHAQAPAPAPPPAAAPKAKAVEKPAEKAAPAAKAPAEQPRFVMPTGEAIAMLVRSSLLSLNDALRTGNFTVLRDLGAPGFRDANSAFKLGQIYSGIVAQGVDLMAVAVIAPQLAGVPTLDEAHGVLRIAGTFPGNPVQINFDATYQAVAGQWRLLALGVTPAASAVPAPQPQAPPDKK